MLKCPDDCVSKSPHQPSALSFPATRVSSRAETSAAWEAVIVRCREAPGVRAVYRRFQEHGRPTGTSPTTQCKLAQATASDSALQNQARKQGNQTEIKPSQTKTFYYRSPWCGVRFGPSYYPLSSILDPRFVPCASHCQPLPTNASHPPPHTFFHGCRLRMMAVTQSPGHA